MHHVKSEEVSSYLLVIFSYYHKKKKRESRHKVGEQEFHSSELLGLSHYVFTL